MVETRLDTIGRYIRDNVIPIGMTVTDAAKLLRVGRPALSNMLNGKASLSAQMAARLDRTFDADATQLLEMQSKITQAKRPIESRFHAAGSYVPSFISIKSNDITDWAEKNINARNELAVLVRKLVHSSGRGLRKVDFPGYDNAESPGWDGEVVIDQATPWIPEGISGWELGTGNDPRTKANGDFKNRLQSTTSEERKETVFVFVTTRRWVDKHKWEQEHQEDWKGVRVLDANDLEQWLEQSAAAQVWMAERLARSCSGIRSLERCWNEWEVASEPRMSPSLFSSSIEAYQQKVTDWLSRSPGSPLKIAGDSIDEVLAFLACIAGREGVPQAFLNTTVVFDSKESLDSLARATCPLIPIVHSVDVERKLSAVYRERHCIVVKSRGSLLRKDDVDILLMPLRPEQFRQALKEMNNWSEVKIERLAADSARSPTILRRRLSEIDAIRKPQWSQNESISKNLIPIALVGAWDSSCVADQDFLTGIANSTYADMERDFIEILSLDDSPVWSVGEYRGVHSKLDVLFSIALTLSKSNLQEFLNLTQDVLSEPDPALDLPQERRWAAAIHDKTRQHSEKLRASLCETLTLLAVHGNTLFKERLGINLEDQVSNIVSTLLVPLSEQVLMSQLEEIPWYAEADPDTVLGLLEEDLGNDKLIPSLLIRPASTGIFGGGCPRSSLLWGLECMAWNSSQLHRVVNVLAEYSITEIDDNWSNKPINSLKSIFLNWMPQTSASLKQRLVLLKKLCKTHPAVGWQVCMDQFDTHELRNYSYRPNWRSDAFGVGDVALRNEVMEMKREAFSLLIEWPDHDLDTISSLISNSRHLRVEYQAEVWSVVETWAKNPTRSENEKYQVWEAIRKCGLNHKGSDSRTQAIRNQLRQLYDQLEPVDLVLRYRWLFENVWLVEPFDEPAKDEDYDTRRERTLNLRLEAVSHIWGERGIEGLLMLVRDGGAERLIGNLAAGHIQDLGEIKRVLFHCLGLSDVEKEKVDSFLKGLIEKSRDVTSLSELLDDGTKQDANLALRVLRCSPFTSSTWEHLELFPVEIADQYWQEVKPDVGEFTRDEWSTIVNGMLRAGRVIETFVLCEVFWESMYTMDILRMLRAIATAPATDSVQSISDFGITAAFKTLENRNDLSQDELASLEFAFSKPLLHSEVGTPNLEEKVLVNPEDWFQLACFAFKRSDVGDDTEDVGLESDLDLRRSLSRNAHDVLQSLNRLPGSAGEEHGDLRTLRKWIDVVRSFASSRGRLKVCDGEIGELLARAEDKRFNLNNSEDMWPCASVCEVLETIQSKDMVAGFIRATLNAHGESVRGIYEGGEQERKLSSRYQLLSKIIENDYPSICKILQDIAKGFLRYAEYFDHGAELYDK